MIDGGDTKLVTAHCTALPQALTSTYLMFQHNVIFQNTKAIKTTKHYKLYSTFKIFELLQLDASKLKL